MRYFHISTGLRGCYMPDNSYMVAVKTRRELKACIAEEAEHQACDGMFVGLSKRNVARFAAIAWSGVIGKLPFALPFGHRPEKIGEAVNYAFGIFVSRAYRAEFLEWQRREEE